MNGNIQEKNLLKLSGGITLIKYIITFIGGALVGLFTMCLLQIDRYEEIKKDSKEEK